MENNAVRTRNHHKRLTTPHTSGMSKMRPAAGFSPALKITLKSVEIKNKIKEINSTS